MKLITITVCFAAAVLAFSCASSAPVEIPEGLTQAELIQRGQEASDRNNYAASIQYYETLIDRYPFELDSVCAGEYEIAFIHYKQKKYDAAKAEFTSLLERYDAPDGEQLPVEFKILSEKVMSRIGEIEEDWERRRQSN